jgi:hypothetical protein
MLYCGGALSDKVVPCHSSWRHAVGAASDETGTGYEVGATGGAFVPYQPMARLIGKTRTVSSGKCVPNVSRVGTSTDSDLSLHAEELAMHH